MSRLDQIYQHDLSSIDQCQQHLGLGVKSSECIRLLRVIDEDSDEAHATSILVELQTTTRSTCPSYIAVSYAWSLDPPTSTIRLTHCLQAMAVTSDLLAAIAALSRIYPGAWFWLDAVSIDQANLAEKSVQVAGMGNTYKQAAKTAVWLGQEFAEDTASSNHPPRVQRPPFVYGLTIASLRNLARRSDRVWWRRTWVVQEMALAQDLEVVVGAQAISWADFVSSFTTVYDMARADRRARADTSVLEATDLAGTNAHIDLLMAEAHGNISQLPILRNSFRERVTGSSNLNFLLLFTIDTRCNDPRDRINALLGLATEFDRSNIKVDYTLSTAQVFTSVARYQAAIYPSDILQWGGTRRAGLAYNPMDETSLPSCVPDYSGEMGINYVQGPHIQYSDLDDLDQYSGGGSSDGRHLHMKCSLGDVPVLQSWVDNAPTTMDDVQPHELHLEGLMFDHVDDIFYAREEDRELCPLGNVMGLDELSRHIPPILRRDLPPSDPRHQIDRSGAFWNTVLLQRPTKPYVQDGKKPASHLAKIYREFKLTMIGAALFTTALGFFGLGYNLVRPGDCVAVLFGGQAPFVLRPTGKPSEYALVGQCFVHGIMHGELIKLLDQGLLETEWFVLV
ncbi:hypothetical protein LTS10_002614 [Elasticomyces elasticus]|nr:hypothetical protein LTS10_002614 [Elasticomyces elasticus]